MHEPSTMAGQALFIGFRGLDLDRDTERLLQTVRPNGVILFARNIDNAAQLKALTDALHARGVRIGIDQEGGRVNRLRHIVGESPRDGRVIGRWLHEFGIDISFAPVVDLEIFDAATDNALRERCWGRTPAEVIAGAGQFLDELQAQGIQGCLKHFPGLGGATLDSHEALPVIERTRAELADDLRPFAALLPRAKSVMVSHGIYPALDPKLPASLSRNVITGLLRQELEFAGEVFTDDMEMGAISQALPFAEAVRAARAAGADRLLICHSPEKILEAHEVLVKLAENPAQGAGGRRARARAQTRQP